ncbi:MAG: RNA 3'-terminal phosphate cyclase [Candidatus Zixiibacteriota bacterium]
MIEIDGSFGEGGGQILRTSLALSLVAGKPFRIVNIRAARKKPGLMHQHLTSVKAAARVGQAQVEGDALGSGELSFAPQLVTPGVYHFDVGTAGSCTLVLQAILPALLIADDESEIILEGGTHNPFAPPFDFLEKAFLPIINRMGPTVKVKLDRPGFFPAGGGKIRVFISPTARLSCIDLIERGQVKRRAARAIVARLPRTIAERELQVVKLALGLDKKCLHAEEVTKSRGPGNVLIIEVESEQLTEVFTGFGERGKRAEAVAEETVLRAKEYLDASLPVGRRLADQLLIPFALAGGGSYRTLSPTDHTTTNIEVIKRFLDVDITATQLDEKRWEVRIR